MWAVWFGSSVWTSASSRLMKSMPANSEAVAARYASFGPMTLDASKPICDLTMISTKLT